MCHVTICRQVAKILFRLDSSFFFFTDSFSWEYNHLLTSYHGLWGNGACCHFFFISTLRNIWISNLFSQQMFPTCSEEEKSLWSPQVALDPWEVIHMYIKTLVEGGSETLCLCNSENNVNHSCPLTLKLHWILYSPYSVSEEYARQELIIIVTSN